MWERALVRGSQHLLHTEDFYTTNNKLTKGAARLHTRGAATGAAGTVATGGFIGRLSGGGIVGRTVPAGEDEEEGVEEATTEEGEAATEGAGAGTAERGKGPGTGGSQALLAAAGPRVAAWLERLADAVAAVKFVAEAMADDWKPGGNRTSC